MSSTRARTGPNTVFSCLRTLLIAGRAFFLLRVHSTLGPKTQVDLSVHLSFLVFKMERPPVSSPIHLREHSFIFSSALLEYALCTTRGFMQIVQQAQHMHVMLKNAFCTKSNHSFLFIPCCNDFVTPLEQSIRLNVSKRACSSPVTTLVHRPRVPHCPRLPAFPPFPMPGSQRFPASEMHKAAHSPASLQDLQLDRT